MREHDFDMIKKNTFSTSNVPKCTKIIPVQK